MMQIALAQAVCLTALAIEWCGVEWIAARALISVWLQQLKQLTLQNVRCSIFILFGVCVDE